MVRISQSVLTALRSSPDGSTVDELKRATGLEADQIVDAADRLSRRGLAIHVAIGRYRRTPTGDQVADAGAAIRPGPKRPGVNAAGRRSPRPVRGDHARGRGTLRDRAWSALRSLKKATLPEILELACRGDEADPGNNVRKYLTFLVEHGIIAVLKRRTPGMAPTSNGFCQYLLLRDLGPKAPLWREKAGELVDRNTGAPIPREEKPRG